MCESRINALLYPFGPNPRAAKYVLSTCSGVDRMTGASERGAVLSPLRRCARGGVASALDARTAAWTPGTVGRGPPSQLEHRRQSIDILASFPPVRGLVFGSTACGGSREVGVLLAQAASSSAYM